MEIIKELDQSERQALRERFKEHLEEGRRLNLLESHIDAVLAKRHCFEVNIFVEDYDEILICAGIAISNSYYATLSKSVRYIQTNPEFQDTLQYPHLNGRRVKEYWDQFNECGTNLPDCFSHVGICLLQDGVNHLSGGPNITEGMHKLVAYGLAANLDPIHFPISIYFGTNEGLPNEDTEEK